MELNGFEFESHSYKPGEKYQKTSLRMIFTVKQDLQNKARLVAGVHLIDALDYNIYSWTVKGISIQILHGIAHKTKLKQLCGDVSIAYVNPFTNKLVYAVAGPEF